MRAVCGVLLTDGERSKDLMSGLNEQRIGWLWQAVCIGVVMC